MDFLTNCDNINTVLKITVWGFEEGEYGFLGVFTGFGTDIADYKGVWASDSAHQPAAGSRGAAGRAAFRAGLFGSLTSDGVYLSGIRNRCDCSDVLCRTGDGYR